MPKNDIIYKLRTPKKDRAPTGGMRCQNSHYPALEMLQPGPIFSPNSTNFHLSKGSQPQIPSQGDPVPPTQDVTLSRQKPGNSEPLPGKAVLFTAPSSLGQKEEWQEPHLQWTTTGPASGMLSCLWCTSSRKSRTPPGSLGTPWSGQVRKWYCHTVLSVFPCSTGHTPAAQNPPQPSWGTAESPPKPT